MLDPGGIRRLPEKWRLPLEAGFHILPVRAGSKQPVAEWKRFREDLPTQAEIWNWDQAGLNVGIITGEPSGACVLDLDSREAVEEARTRGLPPTAAVKTPRGEHHYFKHPGHMLPNAVNLFPGADFRGDGGYVVGPGSTFVPTAQEAGQAKAAGSYSWLSSPAVCALAELPDWLKNSLNRTVPLSETRAACELSPDLSGALAHLRGAQPGERNDRLNAVAFTFAIAAYRGSIAHDQARAELRTIATELGLDKKEIERTLESAWSAGARKSDQTATEDVVAQLFTEWHAGRFVYDQQARGWYEWTGDRWRADAGPTVLHEIRLICRATGKKSLARAGAINGAEALARNDPSHAPQGEWDGDPFLLGTPGGAVDLRTRQIRPATRHDLITRLTSVAPVATRPDGWMRFLEESTGGDEELVGFLQRMFGYLLTGDTSEQALFFVYGSGGNGKSVLIRVVQSILNDYAVTAAMDTFTAAAFQRPPNEIARLAGSRLVTATETQQGHTWNETLIKQLTGGDRISARYLYREFFEFQPQFKLLIVGNYKPQLRTTDDAMRRRFQVVPFERKPTIPNPLLFEELMEEAGSILNWMIDGCLLWQMIGLCPPAAVVETTNSYFDDEDQLGQWLAERCRLGPEERENRTNLLADWVAYASANGCASLSARQFGDLLLAHGFRRMKSNGVRYFLGIGLRQSGEEASGAPGTPLMNC